jgi:hypothetical protein
MVLHRSAVQELHEEHSPPQQQAMKVTGRPPVEQQPQQQATKVDGQPPVEQQPQQQQIVRVDVANTDEEESESDSSSERSSQPRYRREASVPGMPTSPGDESPTEEAIEKIGTKATESLRLTAALAKAAAERTKAAAERSERWRR